MSPRQGSLDEIRRSHRDDPSTSKDAARSVREMAKQHAARVMVAIEAAGVASAEESATAAGLSHLQAMKRISELLQDGFIEVADECGRTATGRRCRRYRRAQ